MPKALRDEYVGLDVVEPEIDMFALSEALGVSACRVTEPDELSDRVRRALEGDRPQLIDVPIARERPDRLGHA